MIVELNILVNCTYSSDFALHSRLKENSSAKKKKRTNKPEDFVFMMSVRESSLLFHEPHINFGSVCQGMNTEISGILF